MSDAIKPIDPRTLLELRRRIGQAAGPTFPVSLSAGTLEILIDAYMDRAAMIVAAHDALRKDHGHA